MGALMARRVRTFAVLLPLLAIVAWIYGAGLDRSPAYLAHDEVVYALNAQSIATTLRDINGQFLPVSIYVTGTFFATPVNIYVTALFLKVAHVSEVTVRMPSVVIGLVNIVLLYFIARRAFARPGFAAIAAGLYALTPAHFVHSRLGTDHEYVVTAVLAWALCLIGSEGTPSLRRLAASGAILGAGVYTYLGALITMPACLLITWAVLWHQGARGWKPYAAPAAGFAVLMLPFVAWHLAHPSQYVNQMRMYSLYDPTATRPVSLTERLSVYWDYFNPSFLFFAGDTSLINGTRYSGVFLWPVMILLPIGLYRLASGRRTAVSLLLAWGLLAAPLAATVVAERYRIDRALVMLPFVAVIAAMGLEALWTARRALYRVAAVVLIAVMPLQFAGFYRDYFGDYRARSAQWLEYNIAGGLETIIARQPATPVPVYIARSIQWVEYLLAPLPREARA